MTITLLIVSAVAYVLCWLPGSREFIFNYFPVQSYSLLPWSVFTYAFAYPGAGASIFFFLINLLWLFWIGSAVEAITGKTGLLIHYSVAIIMHGALGFIAAAALPPFALSGPFLAISWLTVLYAARAPEAQIMFWGLIPIKLKWLAVFIAVIDIMMSGSPNPIHGLIVTSPLLLAWFYGRDMLPIRVGQSSGRKRKRKETKDFDRFYSKVRDKSKEREERERLKKLFEDSLDDDNK